MNARLEIYGSGGTDGHSMDLPVRIATGESPVVVWLDVSALLRIQDSFVPVGAGAQITLPVDKLKRLLAGV